MAHNVKCKVCGLTFDRDKEDATPVGGRRYAHTKCVGENYEPSQEQQDLDKLHAYLKNLFKGQYNYIVLNKQIENFVDINGYSYSGILKSLIYWYEIKGNSLEKADNRIGIVPYIYQEAYNYYLHLYIANQLNADKNIEEYTNPKVREIRIKPPSKGLPTFRLFNLDD